MGMSFGHRLRKLRLEQNMIQEDLSKELNVSRATIGRYETNDRFPDKDILNKIADTFNVSLDYLLGRSKIRIWDTISKENSHKLYDNTNNNIFVDITKEKLIKANLIQEDGHIPKEMIQDIINYGIDAAIKIHTLKNE